MARTKKPRTVRNATPVDATPRHLWLAGLGLAVIARRQSAAAAGILARRVVDARRQAVDAVADARSTLLDTAQSVRAQVEAGAGEAYGKLEAAVAPLAARFGLVKPRRAARRTRKPVAKKAVRRATAARTAKTPVRRSRKG